MLDFSVPITITIAISIAIAVASHCLGLQASNHVKRSIENMRQLLRLPINNFVYTIGAVFTL